MKKFCTCYIRCLQNAAVRWLIIIFWVLAAAAGVIWGLNGFLKSTSLTFTPSPGTMSYDAVNAYEKAFPNANSGEVLLVYVYTIDGSPLVPPPDTEGWEACYKMNPTTKSYEPGPFLEFAMDVNDTIHDYEYPQMIDSFTSYCDIADAFRSTEVGWL